MRYAVSAMSQAANGDKAKGGSRQNKMFNYCDKGGEGNCMPHLECSGLNDSAISPGCGGRRLGG
jgi:hypothetical protein